VGFLGGRGVFGARELVSCPVLFCSRQCGEVLVLPSYYLPFNR
jgi:hypothetical protein